MPPKKKTFFRPIKAKAKSGRGGGDPSDIWNQFMTNFYDDFMETYNDLDEST